MEEKLKIACSGAGISGYSHMIMLERYEPGCCVAFCDLARRLFNDIVGGYLGSCQSAAGDLIIR